MTTILTPEAAQDAARQRAQWHLDHGWYRPVRSVRPADEQRHWASLPDHGFTLGALHVGLRCAGHGTRNVLMLHGFSGRGSQFMHLAEALASQGWRVLLPELPGCGERRAARVDMDDIAQVLQAVAAREGPLHGLVVHSMANVWAWYAMALGLVTAERFVALSGVFEQQLCFDIYQQAHGLRDDEMAALRHALVQREGAARVARQDPRQAMRQVTALPREALIVHAGQDDVVPMRHGRAQAQAWPGAQYLQVEGATHLGLLAEPQARRAVATFFGAA